jgi:ribose 5-phosphate isomerase B
MKIFIATDHRGYQLKEKIKEWLADWGYEYEDFGAYALDAEDDYPDFISKAAEMVSKDPQNFRGIILGASGQGEAILANKYKDVRAIVYYGGQEDIISLSRKHNDANVLSLGAVFLEEETAKRLIKLWLETEFTQDERHIRRINKIKEIEKSKQC